MERFHQNTSAKTDLSVGKCQQDNFRKYAIRSPFLSNRRTLFAIRKKLEHVCLLFFGLLFLVSCTTGNATTEGELQGEKDAIMATIERETEAFFARDYDAWKDTYVQEDYAFQAWSNQDGTFDASVGWNGIDSSVGKYINDNPEPESSHPIVERKNVKYKFYGNDVAYLTWDQFNSDRSGDVFYHSKEMRLLEKVGDEWKIVSVSAFWDFKNIIPADKLSEIQRMDKESRGTDKI